MRTRDYIKKYRLPSILAFTSKVLEAILELLIPLLIARIIDYGINPGDKGQILKYGSLLFILPVAGYLSAMVCQFLASYVSQNLGTDIRQAGYAKAMSLSSRQVEGLGLSSLITRISNDSQQIQQALALILRLVSRVPVLLIGAVVLSFMVSPSIAPIFVIAGLVLGLALSYITIRSNQLYGQVQAIQDQLARKVRENLAGIRVIRAFTNQDLEKGKFDRLNQDLYEGQEAIGHIQALANPSSTLVVNTAIALIIYLGSRLVGSGQLLQGDIVALVNYMNTILLALNQMVQTILIFSRGWASATRMDELLLMEGDEEPSPNTGSVRAKGSSEPASLSFDRVSFSYAGQPAVKDLSFDMEAGSVLGIIGPTGSGKSTLAKLAAGLYQPDKGLIKIDGVDTRDLSLEEHRSMLAYAPQKAVLFSATVRENMAMVAREVSDEEIWQALDLAQATGFVKSLDDSVAEAGLNYSGGQRQRLALARAILEGKPITVLDDSFSALDYKTEALVREGLASLPTSLVLISQRISSIRSADKILVMDRGRIEASGSHDQLMEVSPSYQAIYQSQNRGEGQ